MVKMFFKTGTTYDRKTKIWSGPKVSTPLFHPDCSVGRVLLNMMRIKPKAIALISDTENCSISYEQLVNDSIRIAQNLEKMHLNQSDIIGIVAGHTILTTHVLLACWFNATTFHPVNPAHEQAVVEHLFGITRPKLIFCEGKYYRKVFEACRALQLNAKIFTINAHIEDVPSIEDLMQPTFTENSYEPRELLRGASHTSCILNSSGTSGLPKAVCVSNEALLFNFIRFEESDLTFVFSPLDWVTAIIYTVLTICAGAKRLISTKPYTPEYLVQLIEKYKVTNLMLSPSSVACLLHMDGVERVDFSCVRMFLCGGGMMPPTVFQKLRKLLDNEEHQIIGNGYGSTEIGSVISINDNAKKPSSVGQLIQGAKVKIIDDDGQQLGVGETGEIMLRNGRTWNGYYGNTEETLKMQDAELWFHTGDLGYFDEDGDLFIVDRKKDIMKYCGVHYSPHEIEEAISSLPDVIEVCVFGNTNETEGDRAAAAIVRRQGSQLTEEQVVQHVANKYEVEWKRLHGGVFFLKSLPKTGSGKIIRKDTKIVALAKGVS